MRKDISYSGNGFPVNAWCSIFYFYIQIFNCLSNIFNAFENSILGFNGRKKLLFSRHCKFFKQVYILHDVSQK